jgi:hypothetical protein
LVKPLRSYLGFLQCDAAIKGVLRMPSIDKNAMFVPSRTRQ